MACAGELLCCICFGIPLIICHCCIASSLADSQKTNFLNTINRQHFQGHPVLTRHDLSGILINTDFLSTSAAMMVRDNHPTVVSAYIPQQTFQSQPQAHVENMLVTIPDGVHAGDVMTVQAPTGSTVQVSSLAASVPPY